MGKRYTAFELANRLIAVAPDPLTKRLALAIRAVIRVPMSAILEEVPGKDVSAKAQTMGVSRQSYYNWLNGESRPRPDEAARIAKLTGYRVHEIMGRPKQ